MSDRAVAHSLHPPDQYPRIYTVSSIEVTLSVDSDQYMNALSPILSCLICCAYSGAYPLTVYPEERVGKFDSALSSYLYGLCPALSLSHVVGDSFLLLYILYISYHHVELRSYPS
jgi:hypothetical protein